ncbi:hypothetical protein [Burkholderia diffusa]|nr:hypothetical protein [Burkholderia diffusa]
MNDFLFGLMIALSVGPVALAEVEVDFDGCDARRYVAWHSFLPTR